MTEAGGDTSQEHPMRITAPTPDARVDLDGVDLFDAQLYARGDAHLVWQTLRAHCPVFWSARPAPGFWTVSRHADVRRVLRDHESFSSERGILLSSIGIPDPAAGKMVAVTDPPRLAPLRAPLARPLARHAVGDYAGWLREMVRSTVASARECDVWDAAAAFARLPVASIVTLMDFPREDVETLLSWVYAAVAPGDPHYRTGPRGTTLLRAHFEIMSYLRCRVAERRASPGPDLMSQLLNARAARRPMSDEEAIVNCYNVLLGAAVTTSQAITATLVALAEQGGGEGRWPAGTPIPSAVEESLRWSSPTIQFVRYARHDVVLHGTTIRAGDAVCASIASANRDEAVFDRPYAFDPARTPNPHLAFGSGVHFCVGQSLARLTLQIAFEEFFAKLDCFELAEPPLHLVSNLAAGVVSAPIRLKLRTP
jgi:cytochrome P450